MPPLFLPALLPKNAPDTKPSTTVCTRPKHGRRPWQGFANAPYRSGANPSCSASSPSRRENAKRGYLEVKTPNTVLDGKLMEWGLDGTRLEVCGGDGKAGANGRFLSGDDLRALASVIDEIRFIERVMARRGIVFEPFIKAHGGKKGPLPTLRAVLNEEEHFFVDDAAFNAFRRLYNDERPHEALHGQTPASRYRPSPRAYTGTLSPVEYPGHFIAKRVTNAGTIRLKQRLLFIANALKQHPLGLGEVDDGIWSIHFCNVLLGRVDERDYIIRA